MFEIKKVQSPGYCYLYERFVNASEQQKVSE